MESLKRVAGAVDDVIFQVERVLLLVSLGMMTVLVSVDVVQRTFSRPVGKTEGLLLSLLGGATPDEARVAFITTMLGPTVFWGLALVFAVLATHSSRSIAAERAQAAAPGLGVSLGVGLAVWVAGYAFVKGVLWLFPSSLPGAQKFALGFMLWSGMLGASLATRTRRHIVLDLVKKKLDSQTAKPFALLGGLATFGFCALLAYLGTKQLLGQIEDWRSGDGVGVYDAVPIPTWIATLAVPVTFGVMSLRFLAQGVHDFVWGPPKGGPDAHGIDLDALEQAKPEGETP